MANDAVRAVAHRADRNFFMTKSSFADQMLRSLRATNGKIMAIVPCYIPRLPKCNVGYSRNSGFPATSSAADGVSEPAFFRLTTLGTLPMFRRNFGGAPRPAGARSSAGRATDF